MRRPLRLLQRSAPALLVLSAGLLVGAPPMPTKAPWYADKTDLLVYQDPAGKAVAVTTPADWEKRRAHILASMQEVMGPLPPRDADLALDVQVLEEVAVEGAVRRKVSFVSEKDDRVSAYLFIPNHLRGKVPAVLCLHPTNRQLGKGVVAGLGPTPNRAYALELAQRGFVTLAPDYPNSGEHAFDVYKRGYASATMKAIRDNMRGVDLLQSLPEVDGLNIGCIGHSLGGHNSLFTAAFDTRIKAVVSCCGFTAFTKYKGGNLTGWSHDGYMPRIATVYGKDPAKMPFDFHEVGGAIAPRAFLAVAPVRDDNFDLAGVREVVRSAEKVYGLLGAADKLKAIYPDAAHDFPNDARGSAYAWLDNHLRASPPPRPSPNGGEGEKPAELKPRTPEEEHVTFRVTPGFRVELVAAEPDVIDPVALAFDEFGRLYVAEMRGYPNGGLGEGDITSGRIRLLSDPDEHGRFRKSTVFVEGLAFPTSVMPYDGGLLVGCAPDILFFKDTTGTGKADVKKVVYTGFGRKNIQQLVNHLQWGVDNRIHGCGGANGGDVRCVPHPDMPVVTLRGRNFRFNPRDLKSFEPTTGGGQYALAADDWGHWFTNTNSQHLRQIVLPDHYLRRNPNLAVSAVITDIPDHGAAARLYRISPDEAWRVERTTARAGSADRGRFASTELVPSGYVTSACGTIVHRGGTFPKAYADDVFCCDPANNVVHRDVLVGPGPVFVAERHDHDCEFLAGADNFFRPVDLAGGPDGALYVADFYRGVIETPLSLPIELQRKYPLHSFDRGRIWKVVPDGGPRTAAPLPGKMTTEQLVASLGSENAWLRLTSQRLLIERQAKDAAAALEALAKGASPQGRLHALWTLDGLGALPTAMVTAALADPHPGVRAAALRLAEPRLAVDPALAAAVRNLAALANEPSPDVRFQLAFTLGELPADQAVDGLVLLLRKDGVDPWFQTALLSSMGRSAPAILDRLMTDTVGHVEALPGALLTRLSSLVGATATEAELVAALNGLTSDGRIEPWRVAVLNGLADGLRRSNRPLQKLLTDPPAALKSAAGKLQAFFKAAGATAEDEKAPVANRAAAVRLLGFGRFAEVSPQLLALLAPQQPAEVQLAAVQAVSGMDDPAVGAALLTAWAGCTPNVRREVMEALFVRTDRVAALLTALETGKLPVGQLEPARREQLRRHPDAEIRRRAAALPAGVSGDRRKVVEDYRAALELKGDPAAGKQVFRKHCIVCHKLGGEGVEVGPDLAAALKTKTPEVLLTDIMDPSREVDPRYLNYVVQTKDSRIVSGMLAAETAASVTLRRAQRAEDTLLRSEIDLMKATTDSIMPEGFEKNVSKQDLADLIAYLMASK